MAGELRWWILCRVVDNFGDAGVCWRLARQLATERQAQVRLFIDRPELVSRLSGGESAPAGLVVHAWPEHAPHRDLDAPDPSFDASDPSLGAAGIAPLPLPDVLVSAFGCEPPGWLRARLAGAPRHPLWINLEYLSAEPWVESCHGLASVKPQDGAVEHFFFPGFTAATGGLLRERDAVAPDPLPAGEERARALRSLCGHQPEPGERVIGLFCYPDAPLEAWLPALTRGERPWLVLVPDGVADAALRRFAGHSLLSPGDPPVRQGRLRIARIPFLPQRRYDELLRLCDLNFVRGEDSWIRAHWARRPFVWQPYVQEDNAHLVKLDAFLARFATVVLDPLDANATASGPTADPAWTAIVSMLRAWSGQGDLASAWQGFESRLDTIAPYFLAWTDSLLAQPDLASSLANWALRKL